MSRAVTSLMPFTNRQHSLGAGPTVTLRRRYGSYLALLVSLYSFFLLPDSLTDRRRLGSCFLRLISSSFLSSTVSRSSFERKKRETEKIFLCEKKRKMKLLEGCLCRGHHGNPCQPSPFNVNASSSVALLSKACRGQKKSCSVCALSG